MGRAEVKPLGARGLGHLRLSLRSFAENYELRFNREMSTKEVAQDRSRVDPKGAVLVAH